MSKVNALKMLAVRVVFKNSQTVHFPSSGHCYSPHGVPHESPPRAGCSYSGLSCDKQYVFPPHIRVIHSDTSLLVFWGGGKRNQKTQKGRTMKTETMATQVSSETVS